MQGFSIGAGGVSGGFKPSGLAWLPPLDPSALVEQPIKAVIAAVKQVHALSSAGRFEEALAVLDRPLKGGTVTALATGDLKRAVFGLRGVALNHVGRFGEAAEALKQAIEMGASAETAEVDEYGLPGVLGFALIQLDRFDEAAEAFTRAIEAAWDLCRSWDYARNPRRPRCMVPPTAGRLALENPARALSVVYATVLPWW